MSVQGARNVQNLMGRYFEVQTRAEAATQAEALAALDPDMVVYLRLLMDYAHLQEIRGLRRQLGHVSAQLEDLAREVGSVGEMIAAAAAARDDEPDLEDEEPETVIRAPDGDGDDDGNDNGDDDGDDGDDDGNGDGDDDGDATEATPDVEIESASQVTDRLEALGAGAPASPARSRRARR